MSARAASRLERLGFTVYRYQAGKADWFAAGLPREGHDAGIPRLGDVATRDIPTARLEDRVGEVRDRAALDAAEPLIVVDRSEEHTSELQSPCNLVCRLLLEKKKKKTQQHLTAIKK